MSPGTRDRSSRWPIHIKGDDELVETVERPDAGPGDFITDDGDGVFVIRGRLDAEGAAIVLSALDPLAAPRPAEDGSRDPRPAKRRRADALVELAKHALDGGELAPTSRGARPHVQIIAGLDTLMRVPGAPAAETTWGGPGSAETLRRYACDAGVSFVLVDTEGMPLHVGREKRTVTPAIWAALVARDGGCTFPGCTRPASWSDAHHLRHWSDGGDTSLENSGIACGQHHYLVHHGGWQMRIADDGHVDWIPPPWIDPDQNPRRSTYWHLAKHARQWGNRDTPEPEKAPEDPG